jgi:hypothetical protein
MNLSMRDPMAIGLSICRWEPDSYRVGYRGKLFSLNMIFQNVQPKTYKVPLLNLVCQGNLNPKDEFPHE